MEVVHRTRVVTPGMLQSPFDPDLTRRLETFEADVWRTLYGLATPDEAAALGMQQADGSFGSLFVVRSLDILFFNRVLGLGMTSPARPADLDTVIERFAGAGVRRFFVQMSPAAVPASVFDLLPAHGFRLHNHWAKLFRGVEPPPPTHTDLRIAPLAPEHAEAFGRMSVPSLNWPLLISPWMARSVGATGWRHYGAFDGDRLAAVAGLYVRGACGYLGPAATDPAYRRRGAQSSLIARRILDARALGCTLLVTETGKDRPGHSYPSFRNMQRLGFGLAYYRPNYLYEFPS